MTGGALFRRELTFVVARRSTFHVRTFVASAGGLAAAWMVTRPPRSGIAPGEAALGVLFLILLIALATVLPVLVSPSVVSERRHGTLDVLLASPLGPTRVVLEKWAGGAAPGWGLVAAWIPLAGFLLTAGGVGLADIAALAVAGSAVAAEAAAWAVAASCLAATLEGSAFLALTLLALRWGLPLVGIALMAGGVLPGPFAVRTLLLHATPVPWVMDGPRCASSLAAGTGVSWFATPLGATVPLVSGIAISVTAALLLARYAVVRDPLFTGSPKAAPSPNRGRRAPPIRRPGLLAGNPVLWRECRGLRPLRAVAGSLALLVGGAILVRRLLPTAAGFRRDGSFAAYVWCALLVTLAGLVAAMGAAASARRDREPEERDLLVITPLRTTGIAVSKLKGVALRLLPLFLLPAAAFLATLGRDLGHPVGWACCAVVALAWWMGCLCVGFRWGAHADTPLAATSGAALIVFTALLGPLVVPFLPMLPFAVAWAESTTFRGSPINAHLLRGWMLGSPVLVLPWVGYQMEMVALGAPVRWEWFGILVGFWALFYFPLMASLLPELPGLYARILREEVDRSDSARDVPGYAERRARRERRRRRERTGSATA